MPAAAVHSLDVTRDEARGRGGGGERGACGAWPRNVAADGWVRGGPGPGPLPGPKSPAPVWSGPGFGGAPPGDAAAEATPTAVNARTVAADRLHKLPSPHARGTVRAVAADGGPDVSGGGACPGPRHRPLLRDTGHGGGWEGLGPGFCSAWRRFPAPSASQPPPSQACQVAMATEQRLHSEICTCAR